MGGEGFKYYGLPLREGGSKAQKPRTYGYDVWPRDKISGSEGYSDIDLARRLEDMGQEVMVVDIRNMFCGSRADRVLVVMRRDNTNGVMGFVAGYPEDKLGKNYLLEMAVVLDGRNTFSSNDLWKMFLDGFEDEVSMRGCEVLTMKIEDRSLRNLMRGFGWKKRKSEDVMYKNINRQRNG